MPLAARFSAAKLVATETAGKRNVRVKKEDVKMVRKIALAAALSAGTLFVFASPASAQTYGGITLSFGSGGGYYDDADDYSYYADTRSYPTYDRDYSYDDGYYAQPDDSYYTSEWDDEDD